MPPSTRHRPLLQLLQLQARSSQSQRLSSRSCALRCHEAAARIALSQQPNRGFHGFGSSLKMIQEQRRYQSQVQDPTVDPSAAAKQQVSAETPPPIEQTKKPRSRRRIVGALIFLLIGTAAGSSVRLLLNPPTPPVPGSKEDGYTIEVIRSQAAQLPVVKSLSADPAWESWPAYTGLPAEHLSKRLTTGPLAGSRGLGAYQQVFHNASTGEMVSVLWFGPGTAGWPGVVHGGTIATVLDESCGRCAAQRLPGGTGVTARLELNYLAPTLSNGFYVVRALPMLDGDLADEAERSKGSARKIWVRGCLENTNGKVCVESRALFVAPKGYKLPSIKEGF